MIAIAAVAIAFVGGREAELLVCQEDELAGGFHRGQQRWTGFLGNAHALCQGEGALLRRLAHAADIVDDGLHMHAVKTGQGFLALAEDLDALRHVGREELVDSVEGEGIRAFATCIFEDCLHKLVVAPELVAEICAAVVAGADEEHPLDVLAEALFPFHDAAVSAGEVIGVVGIGDFVAEDDAALVGLDHLPHPLDIREAPQAVGHDGLALHGIELGDGRVDHVTPAAGSALIVEIQAVEMRQLLERGAIAE